MNEAKPIMQRLLAEFLGTFIFVFIGAGAVLSNDATNGGVGFSVSPSLTVLLWQR